jgi:hypothetical protein
MRGDQQTYAFDGGGLTTMHEEEADLSTGKNSPYDGEGFVDRSSVERIRAKDNISPSIREGEDLFKSGMSGGVLL